MVVAVFLAGPTALQGIHQQQVNVEWARQAAVSVPASHGAKAPQRLPVKATHDAESCALCAMIAAPAVAAHGAVLPMNVHFRSGQIEVVPAWGCESIEQAAVQCRGPPTV
jgi:hypothetical protein